MVIYTEASVYFATSRVIKISSGELTIAVPEHLEKRLKRKHKRIGVKDGIYLKFNIILDSNDKIDLFYNKGRVSNKFLEARKELTKPTPDIKKVVTLVSNKLRSNTSIFEVKLHKQKEVYPRRISVLKEIKTTIFISNTKDSRSYFKNLSIDHVTSYLPYIRRINHNKDNIRTELLSIMQEDSNLSLISYICSPIMLFERVIGHIFLGLTKGSHNKFSDIDAYSVTIGSNLISKAIAKNKLHKLNTGDDFDILVTNISAGGLLIELSDQLILKHLSIYTKLSMTLKLYEREVKATTTVIRINKQENGNTIIAVKFVSINWNEREYIDKYVNRQLEINKMQSVN